MSDKDIDSRRNTLKMIGFGAVAGIVGVGISAGAAEAQETPAIKAMVNPRIGSLKLVDPVALRTVNLTKRLPADTPITKMLTPGGASALTPAAAGLTKADLVNMQSGRVIGKAKTLTVKDVASIQSAFGRVGGLGAAMDVSCCCCTPCCCAAAIEPELALAA